MRDKILRLVELYDRRKLGEARAAGRRRGALGAIAVKLYKWLVCLNARSARLEPSIAYMAKTLGHARSTIVECLKALREHGFLDWIRRHDIIDDAAGWGPQIKQATNAYRVNCPPGLEYLLDTRPDDDTTRRATMADELRRMANDESGVTPAIDRLGAAIEARDRNRKT